MNKARLEKLIVALEGVKPRDFNMTVYLHPCGSPACVLGYFASRGDLQRKFKLTKHSVSLRDTDEPVDFYDEEVCGYFGITYTQAESLFGCEGANEFATPAQMRRRIRKFIDKNVP